MPDQIAQGLRSIRRSRGVVLASFLALASLLAAFGLLDQPRIGFLALPVAAFAGLAWLVFVYRPCPKCGMPFFVQGDPSRNPFLLRFGANPFRSSCFHCGQRLYPNSAA